MNNKIQKISVLGICGFVSFGLGISLSHFNEVKVEAGVGNYTDVGASTYYDSITATGGTELLGQLHDLITTTHRTYPTYNDSGTGTTTEYVLALDGGIDNEHVRDFYSGNGTFLSTDWTPTVGGGWNREHVWCKSLSNGLWSDVSGNNYNGGTDMHHIRPSEQSVNSSRGNHPYGIATDHSKPLHPKTPGDQIVLTDVDCGYVSNGVFEPIDSVKGDVARILMYVYTHYNSYEYVGGTTNGTYGKDSFFDQLYIKRVVVTSEGTTDAAWKLLLNWSTSDPVDESEIIRNNAAAKYQGNRNPFIDNPNYANLIWGNRTVEDELLPAAEITGDQIFYLDTNKTPIATSTTYANYRAENVVSQHDSSVKGTWKITTGNKQSSGQLWLGTNDNQKTKMTLGNGGYSEASGIASAIGTTTTATYYTALIGETNFANVGQITLFAEEFGGSTGGVTNTYFLSSTNGTSWTLLETLEGCETHQLNLQAPIASARYAVVFYAAKYVQIKGPSFVLSTGGEVKEVSRIEVSDATTTYYVGDSFVKPTVTAYYSNGESEDVSVDASFSGYNMNNSGTQTVTVTYGTATATYEITVNALEVSSLTLSNKKTEYTVGDDFVKPTVTAKYSNGTSKNVTNDATFTGYDMSTAGTQTVTATYGGKTATYDITVEAAVTPVGDQATYTITGKTSVTSSGAPTGSSAQYATTYSNMNQLTNGNSATLTLSGYAGLKITAISLEMRSNASGGGGSFTAVAGTTTISSIVDSKFNTPNWNGAWSTANVKIVPAMSNDSYSIKSNETVVLTINSTANSLFIYSCTITYAEAGSDPVKTLESITLSGQTTSFTVGDTFSFGGTVTAHYSDSSTDDVTASTTFSGYDMSTASTQTVTATYEGKTATYSITVENGTTPVGEGYRIVFDTVAEDVSSEASAEQLLGFIREGASKVGSISPISKAYLGVNGVKIGSSKATGNFTINLSNDGKVTCTDIKVGIAKYGSDTGQVVVSTNFDTTGVSLSPLDTLTEFSTELSGNLTSMTFATTSKRAYISYIKVVTSSTPSISVSLNKSATTLEVNETETLTATTTGEATLSWSTSNEWVATVNDGTITAIGGGVATITATYGEETAICTVTVNEEFDEIFTETQGQAGIARAKSLSVGDVVYLVSENYMSELSGISTTSTKYGLRTVYSSSIAKTYPLTVCAGSATGSYAFKGSDDKYLTWTSGNSLNVNATLSANTSWNVAFDANGNATIINVADSARQLCFNGTSGQERFACYTGKTLNDGTAYPYVQLLKESSGTVKTTYNDTVNSNSAALNFAHQLLDSISRICKADGTTASAELTNMWNTLFSNNNSYYAALNETSLNMFKYAENDASGDTFQKVASAYDYIVSKYNLTDHLGRKNSTSSKITSVKNDNAQNAVIAVIGILSFTAIAYGCVRFKKKHKED